MKKMLTLTMIALMLATFGVTTAEAASSDAIGVTVTITASALDVSVSPNAWAIGGISESDTPNTTLPDFFTATNDRNSAEDLTLTVASSADWTADGAAAGADQFAMQFSTGGNSPVWTTIAVPAGSSLISGLAASANEKFDLKLLAPTSTTVGGTLQTIVVTVTAS